MMSHLGDQRCNSSRLVLHLQFVEPLWQQKGAVNTAQPHYARLVSKLLLTGI